MKNVSNRRVNQQVSIQVAHNLVYIDHYLAIWPDGELYGFDMRIDQGPLPGPIFSDTFAPVNMSSFHPICPNHTFLHRGKRAFQIPGMETFVEALQQLFFGTHLERTVRVISATLAPRIRCASSSRWIPSKGLRFTISPASRNSQPDLPTCQA